LITAKSSFRSFGLIVSIGRFAFVELETELLRNWRCGPRIEIGIGWAGAPDVLDDPGIRAAALGDLYRLCRSGGRRSRRSRTGGGFDASRRTLLPSLLARYDGRGRRCAFRDRAAAEQPLGEPT
jgi:hypothetical protein